MKRTKQPDEIHPRQTRFERRLEQLRVTVIGAGRAGSFACLALGMAGVKWIRVYDHDRLDPARNLRVQFYRAADVRRRRPKVEALQRILREVCPGTVIEGIAEQFPDGVVGPCGPVVLFGMDTMEARRRAAEALARDRSLGCLVDIRLGGSVLHCHTVRGRAGLTAYRSALYDDDDAWGAACADSPDPHVALASAAVAVSSVMAYLRGVAYPELVMMDVGPRPGVVVDASPRCG
jgi:molybdopterin/thiamine biosynthesis adenylyltransferase